MRITEEYSVLQSDHIEVVSAKYIGDFAIRIQFNDGTSRLVDFKPFLESSLHPSIRKYLDEVRFMGFALVDGNLNWNDYELIFPVDDLYNGAI